jgi:predicted nucleic acid-binding Zn ribbon protein
MMIPLWVGVLSANGYESKRLKDFFRDYLSKYYSQKLQDYDQKPVDLLNSDTEDILDLFADKELISDPIIENLSKESKKITNFMYSVFLIMPILLVVTYFVILK